MCDFLFDEKDSTVGEFPQLLEHLWLAPEDAEAVMHALLPKLKKSRKEVETTLFEVRFY